MTRPMLRLLGGIDFSPSASGGTARLGRKPQALLALVAASGARGATRERLVRAIWADSDEHAGAAALR